MEIKDDVEIRVVEASDRPSYKCQFRKKGKMFWQNLKTYNWTHHRVDILVYRYPSDFSFCKDYDYERCLKHNEEAYKFLKEHQQQIERNKYTVIK